MTNAKVTIEGPELFALVNDKEGGGMTTKAKATRNAMKNRTWVRVFVITIDSPSEE